MIHFSSAGLILTKKGARSVRVEASRVYALTDANIMDLTGDFNIGKFTSLVRTQIESPVVHSTFICEKQSIHAIILPRVFCDSLPSGEAVLVASQDKAGV